MKPTKTTQETFLQIWSDSAARCSTSSSFPTYWFWNDTPRLFDTCFPPRVILGMKCRFCTTFLPNFVFQSILLTFNHYFLFEFWKACMNFLAIFIKCFSKLSSWKVVRSLHQSLRLLFKQYLKNLMTSWRGLNCANQVSFSHTVETISYRLYMQSFM